MYRGVAQPQQMYIRWADLRPTLLPGLGPRFLGILTGSRLLLVWMLCSPNADAFWFQGGVTLVFRRPGLRPL